MSNKLPQKRGDIVDLVLSDLRQFKNLCDQDHSYAVDENIRFFEAARHVWTYLPWLILRYPTIDKTKIKELADFHLHDGAWEENLLRNLIRLEKSPMIDLVGPLRQTLLQKLHKISAQSKHPLVVINVGCGAMEIEKQIISRLKEKPLPVPVIFIGVDNSEAAFSMARDNLRPFDNLLNEGDELSSDLIAKLKQSDQPYTIQFIRSDVFTLSALPPNIIDLIFYSKFLHHLPDNDKHKFKELVTKAADHVIEFDDYRGWYLPIMSFLSNWRQPILLNGAVFSALRVPTMSELQDNKADTNWRIKIIRVKGYIKTYDRS
jgi:SAM-dependent methyltransferase